MNELRYTVFGFAAGLGLLVVYATALWWGHRTISRRASQGQGHQVNGAAPGNQSA